MEISNTKFILDKLSKYNFKNKRIITSNDFNTLKSSFNSVDLLINNELTNNFKRINKFHEHVNLALNQNGLYLSSCEILENRRLKLKKKNPRLFKIIFRLTDFFFNRVIPKLYLTKNVYFFITRGRNRVISKAENLGRLISCGFDIVDYFEYQNIFYVLAKKKRKPDYNSQASYGPLFKMNRVGYSGKIIGVYKLRTMYPYSEYCQNLIIEENKLAKTGKVHQDYRLTTWGVLFRKYWIDEFPMIINLIKGDLNIFGVRPLSRDYFLRYPKDLQKLRIKFKPGLIPPYYSDLPTNFDEIIESERKYLMSKLARPFITDFVYFFRAVYNIVIKGVRSS